MKGSLSVSDSDAPISPRSIQSTTKEHPAIQVEGTFVRTKPKPTKEFRALQLGPKRQSTLSLLRNSPSPLIMSVSGEWRPLSPENTFIDMPSDNEIPVDLKTERNYIERSQLESASRQRLPHVVIQRLKRPVPYENVPYGVPNYTSRWHSRKYSPVQETIDDLTKVPSFVRTHPKQHSAVRCNRSDHTMGRQFCDVLGPSACSYCIECTNKKIASRVQNVAFPNISMTCYQLVAPQLGRTLIRGTNGHKNHCIYCRPFLPKVNSKTKSYRFAPKQRVERPYCRTVFSPDSQVPSPVLPNVSTTYQLERKKSRVQFNVTRLPRKQFPKLPDIKQ